MSPGGDEVGRLLERLERGEWEALLEPGAEGLLVVALLVDAGWWEEAVDVMTDEMHGPPAVESPAIIAARQVWRRERTVRAALSWAAAVSDAQEAVGVDVSKQRSALAILERLAPR